MSVAPPAESCADPAVLRRSLARDGEEVVVRRTERSIVFLVGGRAYRLPRPTYPRHEADLNATLAPGIVLGTRAVVPCEEGTGYLLAEADDSRAIDHVVEMRRFDQGHTMSALIQRDALTLQQAGDLGARLAPFHRGAKPQRRSIDYRALIDRNFEALLPLVNDLVPNLEGLMLQRFAAAFLLDWADVLKARATAGSVVEGHGDLRAEHVLFESGEVLIIDRAEPDSLVVDVADDLGFLLMDLGDLSGAPDAGDAVLAGYQRAGGAAQPEALLAFFGAYRAQVRAKVALLHAAQPGVDARAQQERARGLLALSRRLGWRARGPLLLLVTGPPAAGKSTLAAALGRASGLPVLSADVVRGEHRGGSPADDTDRRAAIYAELGRRAGLQRAVIVDAGFGDPVLNHAFREHLEAGGAAAPLVVECRAPAGVRDARAGAVRARVDAESDGAATHLAVDTGTPISLQVDEVTSWLDSLLADGRSN
jgi:aminoglycoside phosphotransferase family enzyme/predicted kinase